MILIPEFGVFLFRIRKTLLLFMLVFAALHLFAAGMNESPATVRILYSASLNGNLDGCDCKTNKRAGLVKRAVFLRENHDPATDVLISGGDFSDASPDMFLSDLVYSNLADLRYTVLVPGDQEFINGIGYLQEKILNYPLFCRNLSFSDDGFADSAYKQPFLTERRGIPIEITAIIDPQTFFFYPEEIRSAIQIEDPMEFLTANYPQKPQALWIIVYHGSESGARKLLSLPVRPDLLFIAHEQKLIDEVVDGEVRVVSPGEQGNRLGILELQEEDGRWTWENRFILFEYEKDPDDPAVRGDIVRYIDAMTSKIRKTE